MSESSRIPIEDLYWEQRRSSGNTPSSESTLLIAISENESTTREEKTETSINFEFYPILLVVFSCICYSLGHTYGRLSIGHYNIPPFFVAASRGCLQTLWTTFLFFAFKKEISSQPLHIGTIIFLAFRGIVGATAATLMLLTLNHVSTGTAGALFATTPVFSALLGRIFLKEYLTSSSRISLCLCVIGAIIVAFSTPNETPALRTNDYDMELEPVKTSRTAGVLFGLGASLSMAMALVAIRKMGTKVHFSLNVFSVSIFSMLLPMALTIQLHGKGFKDGIDEFLKPTIDMPLKEAVSVLGVAVFFFLGTIAVNIGAQKIPVSVTAVVKSIDIPMHFIAEYLILSVSVSNPGEYLGSAMICLSTYFVVSQSKKSR